MVAKLCVRPENITDEKNKNKRQTSANIDEHNFTDLYFVGKIWIDALKACLVGAEFNIFPVVQAAKAEPPPKKPPPMKLTDLSVYQSPHHDYKNYLEDQERGPATKVKLAHRSILPHVKYGREQICKYYCQAIRAIRNICYGAVDSVKESKRNFKETMRNPDNLAVRQAVVATGGVLGYLIGGGGGIPRRLFFTTAGLLSTGALCFPKETDDAFRNVTYIIAKSLIAVYNKWGGTNFNLRERLACRDELPKEPPKRPPVKCPPK